MPSIGVVVVAYNAAATLAQVLDRIPSDFRDRISGIFIGDNNSEDQTYLVGLGYQQIDDKLPLTIVRHPRNLGYGGNQKAGYRWAIEQGYDIVVLLHADGQYAPEFLTKIVEPLENGEADAVFGSRMMQRGDALRGGMPFYKYVGNRILTTIQNGVTGAELSEWHSGYRAYNVSTLEDVPFERAPDGFDFDTGIILQLLEGKKRIVELPIPTFYGDEISHVVGLKYAKNCVIDVLRYRAHKMGLGTGGMAFSAEPADDLDERDERVHSRIVRWFRERPSSRILDLGCGDAQLAAALRALGHEVTGVDIVKPEHVAGRVDRFVEADLEKGIPSEAGGDYDVVLAIDTLGHLRAPEVTLRDASRVLRPGGSIIASVPNFGHWYPRLRVAFGRFDYDQRGILDRHHLRFFTRRSFLRTLADTGLSVRRDEPIGMPLEVLTRRSSGHAPGTGTRIAHAIDRVGTALRPSLFAYQFLFELEVAAGDREAS